MCRLDGGIIRLDLVLHGNLNGDKHVVLGLGLARNLQLRQTHTDGPPDAITARDQAGQTRARDVLEGPESLDEVHSSLFGDDKAAARHCAACVVAGGGERGRLVG